MADDPSKRPPPPRPGDGSFNRAVQNHLGRQLRAAYGTGDADLPEDLKQLAGKLAKGAKPRQVEK